MTCTILAEELWHMVFSFLDYKTIPKAQLVCCLFNIIGASNSIWKQLCSRHFIDGSLFFKIPNGDIYKTLFKRLKGLDLNGTWGSYTMREGQEQEENMREKVVYLSTQIDKKRRSPLTIESLYSETTPTTNTSLSTPSNSVSNNNINSNNNNNDNNNNNNNNNGSTVITDNFIDEEDHEQMSPKRRRSNSVPFPPPTTSPSVPEFISSCAFLGVGKAAWGDMVVTGCQWGQYNCAVQLYFQSNFRTICLYESSPSGRALIGVFHTNWFKLSGAAVMCVAGTPKSTAWQAMSHAWSVYHSTHRWEGLIGDWVITFTYHDGREQVITFGIKTQRKLGISGVIKGIYCCANDVPMLHQGSLNCNAAEKNLQRSTYKFQNAPGGITGTGFPTFSTPNVEAPIGPATIETATGVDVIREGDEGEELVDDESGDDRDQEETDQEEQDQEQQDQQGQPGAADSASTHPPLLGTVVDQCVGLSFYTLAGTPFGKFITCTGEISPPLSSPSPPPTQTLWISKDEYVIRDITMRGYFMEKVLDPHADQNTTPRAEEGTWKAVRRSRIQNG